MDEKKFKEWYLKAKDDPDVNHEYLNYVDAMERIAMEPLDKDIWAGLYYDAELKREERHKGNE